jgi:hypothetical protein
MASTKNPAETEDAKLLRLASTMKMVERELHAAMDRLESAEKRLSQLPGTKRARGRRPAWYLAAVQKERITGKNLERTYHQIARVRAKTKVGLAIKVRLLADLYGELVGSPDDMMSVLLKSLLEDLTEGLQPVWDGTANRLP